MSSSVAQTKESVPRGVMLADLQRRLRVQFALEMNEFWFVAAVIHSKRKQRSRADTDLVNRSTGLWTALTTDPEVGLAAAEGMLSAKKLGNKLGIVEVTASALAAEQGFKGGEAWAPPAAAARAAQLGIDDTLADALTSYVEANRIRRPLRVVDLALAVLESARDQQRGLLSGRLHELGVDVEAAIDGLRRRLQDAGVYGFSRSVRAVRSPQPPDEQITAGALAAKVYGGHAYAGTGATPDFDQESGPRDTVDGWLLYVREAYAAAEVVSSDRGVIDGELTIRALVDMAPNLRSSLDADPPLATWLERIRPVPRPDSRTRPSVDEPAAVDLLGRQALAKAIVEFFGDIGTGRQASLIAHLDAPWGEGKSSLLRFIQEEAADDYLTVEVNAWREQRVGTQWWTLYRALRLAERTRTRNPFVRFRIAAANLIDVVVVRRDRVWPVVLTTVIVVGALVAAIWRFDIAPEEGFGALVPVFSILAVVFAGITALYRFLAPTSARDARALMETSGNPMNEVRALFVRTLRRVRQPVLFLIDDLDRCEPKYVIQFLEVVHTLVRDPQPWQSPAEQTKKKDVKGPYAVIAADGRWLRLCYQQHYSDLMLDDSPAMPLGYAFLDKIFQLHIRLPNIEPELKRRYYESLLFPGQQGNAGPAPANDDPRYSDIRSQVQAVHGIEEASEASDLIGEVPDSRVRAQLRGELVKQFVTPASRQHQLHELAPFCSLLDSNPRTIRLFVNAVSLQAAMRLIEGARIDLAPLALWAIAERRWPALAEHLRDHPDDVATVDPKNRPNTLTKELAELLCTSAVREVLYNERWGHLDAERIRASTGVQVGG
jgi:KAP-like P-loop domain-containing protein